MGVHLTIILSGRAYEEHTFEDFNAIRIGRAQGCDVRIDNIGLSRQHVEITNLGGTYQLQNLSKPGKTLVNGAKVETHNLNDGDAISLGKFTIAFSCDDAWDASGSGTEVMGELTIGNDEAALKGKEASVHKVLGYLEFPSDGRDANTRLLTNAFFQIGKDPDSDVQLEGWSAPRIAALLIRDDSGFSVMDVSAKADSVKVNGTETRGVRLSDGDALDVRGTIMTFHYGSPE